MNSSFFANPEYVTHIWGLTVPERFQHPIEEYSLIRESYGVLDFTGLEYIQVSGKDAASFLQGLLTHNNLKLKQGESSKSWLLDSGGKIQAALHVARVESNRFFLQCLPGQATEIAAILNKYIFMEDISLSVETDLLTWSFQGAAAQVPQHLPDGFQFPHSWCGEPGTDFVFSKENMAEAEQVLRDNKISPLGLTAMNIRRTELLVPWFGVDIEIAKNPLIYGKGEAISYSKGCYLGQETIAMTRDRGRPPMLLCQFESPDSKIPPAPITLLEKDRPVGNLTTIIFSPEFEKPIALGTMLYTKATKGSSFKDQHGQTWSIRDIVTWKTS